jgi:hypothetical protein
MTRFRSIPLQCGVFILIGFLAFLAACGDVSGEPPTEGQIEDTSDIDSEGSSDTLDLDEFMEINEGTDLNGVNVCSLISLEEVAEVTGALREDETEEEIQMDREVGCRYYDQQGRWYVLTFYPLDQWGLVELTLNEAEAVEGVLDGAWLGRYSSNELLLKALVDGEMVISAHVSDGNLETAIQLVELANQYRPQSIGNE